MQFEPCALSPTGRQLLDRRHFLSRASTGLASIALAHVLHRQGLLVTAEGSDKLPLDPRIDPRDPFAARHPHFPPRAKNAIVIFCCGGLSHVDTFDFKPDLIRYHDQPLPTGEEIVSFQGANGNLIRPLWEFKRRGQTGKMISDLLPNIAGIADDLAFIHSMTSPSSTHGPAETFMSTGFTAEGYPSIGAWVSYALGTEDTNLPAFVAIPDPRGVPQASLNNWTAGFLPAMFQGTAFNATQPIRNLRRPPGISPDTDRATRNALLRFNEAFLDQHAGESDLAARIASYELAARMQLSIPEITDLATEPAHVLKSYGGQDTSNGVKAGFARNCILARRLIERGVRFIQVFNGSYSTSDPGDINWDAHSKIEEQYKVHGPILDQPVAALVKDLKQRGMLDETLVVFCTEFGRYPMFQKGTRGRDHNPDGFTCWLAGAGVKQGFSHGRTDEFGRRAVTGLATVYDLHATILHLFGLDHERLTYLHNGRRQRLTDVHGSAIREVLS